MKETRLSGTGREVAMWAANHRRSTEGPRGRNHPGLPHAGIITLPGTISQKRESNQHLHSIVDALDSG